MRRLPLLAFVIIGCGGERSEGRLAEIAPSAELHDVLACPWVATGCKEDQDGCPDQEGHAPTSLVEKPAACGAELPSAQLLADVAGQLRTKSLLTKVRIVAASDSCAGALKSELERTGASHDRLEVAVRPGTRFARFEVAAWSGARCP